MRLGRKSKWALAIFSGLLALIVLLHTGAAKELARRGIEIAAGSLLDGRASLEALDYRLWSGEGELSGIVLEPDLSVLPFHFTSEHIALSVSPSLTFSGTVEGAELVLIDLFETPTSDYTPLLTPRHRSASSWAAKPSVFGIKSYAFRSTSCFTGASIGTRAMSSPPPVNFD